MIYLKAKKSEFGNLLHTKGDYITIEVYEDMFCSICPVCQKEKKLDCEELKDIMKDSDFSSTSIFCSKECAEKFDKKYFSKNHPTR